MGRSRLGPGEGSPKVVPRIRVLVGAEIRMGPGKADLREAIRGTGSIRAAANRLRMSYMRAWLLVRTMNAGFREPLVLSERGGGSGGRAALSPTGERVLALYREMEAASGRAIAPAWARMRRLF